MSAHRVNMIFATMLVMVGITWAAQLRFSLLLSYERHVMPSGDNNNETRVTLEFELLQIHNLDVKEQALSVYAKLVQKWNDSRLSWNPQDVNGVKHIILDDSDIWIPDVKLVYSVGGRQSAESSLRVNSNGVVVRTTTGDFRSPCTIDLEYYPYDRQWCLLRFAATYPGANVYMGEQHINLKNYFRSSAWVVLDVPVNKRQTYDADNDVLIHDVAFNLKLTRQTERAWRKVAPPFVLLVLGLLGMLVPSSAPQKVVLQALAVLGVIALQVITAAELPISISSSLLERFQTAVLLLLLGMTTMSVLGIIIYNHGRQGRPLPSWLQIACMRRLRALLCAGGSKHKEDPESDITHQRAWWQVSLLFDRLMFVVFMLSSIITVCCMRLSVPY